MGCSSSASPTGGAIRVAERSASRSEPVSVNAFISRSKEQRRNGLEPSGAEFIAYARYLGIDSVVDHDLLWIAEEALKAPLPLDWSEHFDSDERVFFYNATTRLSSWTHPLEHLYREAYATVVSSRSSDLSSDARMDKLRLIRQDVEQLETFVGQEISHWTEHTDDRGHRFYFNRRERLSNWTDPRPALCKTLFVKMKTLRLLESGAGVTPVSTDAKYDGLSHVEPIPVSQSENAAFNQDLGETGEAAAVGSCIVCLSASATHVIVPCGHQALCEECAKHFKEHKKSYCPCCRTPITHIIKVYVPAPRQIMPKRPEEEPKKPHETLETDILIQLVSHTPHKRIVHL